MILVLSVLMFTYFSYCVIMLRKTYNKITFDSLALIFEMMKVPLWLKLQIFFFVMYEFVLLDLVWLLLVMILQTLVRTFICGNFFKRGMIIFHYVDHVTK